MKLRQYGHGSSGRGQGAGEGPSLAELSSSAAASLSESAGAYGSGDPSAWDSASRLQRKETWNSNRRAMAYSTVGTPDYMVRVSTPTTMRLCGRL